MNLQNVDAVSFFGTSTRRIQRKNERKIRHRLDREGDPAIGGRAGSRAGRNGWPGKPLGRFVSKLDLCAGFRKLADRSLASPRRNFA